MEPACGSGEGGLGNISLFPPHRTPMAFRELLTQLECKVRNNRPTCRRWGLSMEGTRIGPLPRGFFDSTQVGDTLSLPTSRQCEGLG